jgi:hypothetical protein
LPVDCGFAQASLFLAPAPTHKGGEDGRHHGGKAEPGERVLQVVVGQVHDELARQRVAAERDRRFGSRSYALLINGHFAAPLRARQAVPSAGQGKPSQPSAKAAF